MSISITRIKLSNYRGIRALDLEVPPGGVIASGGNAKGKTTLLRSIAAGLASSDIGADAVTIGEERGEILIDLDQPGGKLHVHRRFGASGSTLQIKNDAGDVKAKPAQLLAELLGATPIDVMALIMERDKKKRRAAILQALPVTVTIAQLRQWVPTLPDGFDVSGHGLEVIERLRSGAYEKRTAANRVEKETEQEAVRAETSWRALAQAVLPGARTPEETAADFDAARQALDTLRGRQAAAKHASARLSVLRERATCCRAQAHTLVTAADAAGIDQTVVLGAREDAKGIESRLRQLEAQSAAAKEELRLAALEVAKLETACDDAGKARVKAAELISEAEQLEASIAGAVEVIDAGQVAAAEKTLSEASAAVNAASAKAAADAAKDLADARQGAAALASAEAARLDRIVRGLTIDAPAQALAGANVPGLSLDGDEVRLNGVALDSLSGKEQVVFAAQIARALSPGVAFMVADRLEALDEEQLALFVAEATKGGRQLFGSRVDPKGGELQLVHLGVESTG